MNTAAVVKYRPVTPAVIAALQQIVGDTQVLCQDQDKLAEFSHDEIPGTYYRTMPEAVVFPATAAEVAAVVKLANQECIPLTPRGAGSGLSGGAVPVYGGIVVSTRRLNRILEIDPDNMMITVEPGVIANDLNEHLKPYGLFYA
ncbi:MAG: FAD-binding oxidoreductase, partial [Lentisphaerae bacterium]|nr:FAD-binding oxidoreductase [Lentisphaerota bacterium]